MPSTSKEATWPAAFKAAGINCVRVADFGQNSVVVQSLGAFWEKAGFFVEIGNDGDPTAAGYAAGVVAGAKWAQANGIQQYSVGNESHTARTQALLASVTCQVRQVYSGIITYSDYKDSNYDPIAQWASNMGCLDKLGLNTYADYANTALEASAALGNSHFYFSETNLDCGAGQCGNDSTWASGLQNILSIEGKYGVQSYVFAYQTGGDEPNPVWSIVGHPQVMAVLGL